MLFLLCVQYFLNVRGGGGITMTGTPHSFRKSHIISIDALSEDSSLYEEALAA